MLFGGGDVSVSSLYLALFMQHSLSVSSIRTVISITNEDKGHFRSCYVLSLLYERSICRLCAGSGLALLEVWFILGIWQKRMAPIKSVLIFSKATGKSCSANKKFKVNIDFMPMRSGGCDLKEISPRNNQNHF